MPTPLPHRLQEAIEALARDTPPKVLARAAEALGSGYRDGRSTASLRFDAGSALAYAVVRLPATHAVASSVLEELHDLLPAWEPTTHLDLGSGPGTAAWAGREAFPSLSSHHLIEGDPAMQALGAKLLEGMAGISWDKVGALRAERDFPPADLVTMIYAGCELPDQDRREVFARAWEATGDVFVLIEPGTTRGYEILLQARRQLVPEGATILAPCPHGDTCPMEGTGSWCHFVRRLSRSRRHRMVKEGNLGYEDEKYCYGIFSKIPAGGTTGRVTRPPKVSKAAVTFEACLPAGLAEVTIPRREKERWKAAKSLRWGDRWEP